MIKINMRFWLYDPDGNGMVYFRSVVDRDVEAQRCIDTYLVICVHNEKRTYGAADRRKFVAAN